MIGIYKIVNKENGKCYVGQSNDILRRFSEHQTKGDASRIPVDVAIQKHGKSNFSYEVLEECPIKELNEREVYWISQTGAYTSGYNCNTGGDQCSIGELNSNAKLTEADVIAIRMAYRNHLKQKEVYENYKNKISFVYFQNVWQGRSWAHIEPEVFTKENKEYYIYQNSIGENGSSAAFTDKEVLQIRKRYVKESAPKIYNDYNDRVKYSTFQAMLWGRSYKHLPVYSKKTKQWINN